ncbi:hypothetical protein Taro_009228 [Colocasia esculenta]|uniref:Uncharacterized protein n=1 Tax=Colocasia esculenta TaxID=4460 RepID=A0A843TZJ2_COLES|nr:hypothetical protein [Colocasia esculenta]
MTEEIVVDRSKPIVDATNLYVSFAALGHVLRGNPDAQRIISSGWPGLTVIHMELTQRRCGLNFSILNSPPTVSGFFSCLLECFEGRGIRRNFISDAARKLPLLRKIALDTCDACEGGFDSPSYSEKCFLSTVKIARCKSQRCSFDLQKLGNFRPMHKDTIVQVRSSKALTTTCVKERV